MSAWMRVVQVLSVMVVLVGGHANNARAATAVSLEDCDCYDWYEAIADQQAACSASAAPGQVLCAYVYSCYRDELDHVHYSGICLDYTPDPCPPVMPQGPGCEP